MPGKITDKQMNILEKFSYESLSNTPKNKS